MLKGMLRCNGVRTVRHYPVKNKLSLHCSQIALSQKVVKEVLLLNKRIKLFFKDLQRPLKFHHPPSESDIKELNFHCTNSQNISILKSQESVRKG